jgi:VWFA-related protein
VVPPIGSFVHQIADFGPWISSAGRSEGEWVLYAASFLRDSGGLRFPIGFFDNLAEERRAMSMKALFLLSLLIGGLLPWKSEVQDHARLRTELVLLDVAVFSRRTGQVIRGLRKDDFLVYEDGVKQRILHFSQESPPLSIVFVLFLLPSPPSASPWRGSWWERAQAADGIVETRRWVDGLTMPHTDPYVVVPDAIGRNIRQLLQRLRAEDNVAMMVYNLDTIWLIHKFAEEKSLIGEKIVWKEKRSAEDERVYIWSEVLVPPLAEWVRAAPHRALYEATRYLENAAPQDRRRVIIVITDDMPWPTRAASWVLETFPPREGTFSKDEIAKYMLISRITVYALVIPNPHAAPMERSLRFINLFTKPWSLIRGYAPWDYASITFYAERTGGEVQVINGEDVVTRLEELIDRLYSRYSLGYIPSNMKRDGKFRKIEVRVSPEVERREGGVIIRARKGYYAPREGSRR